MPGPASAPLERHDPGLNDKHPSHHGRCQDRDRCTGPGCRVRTGKTKVAHGLARRQAEGDVLERTMRRDMPV